MQPVHFLIGHKICPKQNAVGVFDQKFARSIRLTAKFGRAGAAIDHHIRIFIEQLTYISEVLRFFRKVGANKCCFRMPSKDGVSLSE